MVSSGVKAKTEKLFWRFRQMVGLHVPLFSVLLIREPIRYQNSSPIPPLGNAHVVTAVQRGLHPSLLDLWSLPEAQTIDCLFSTIVKTDIGGTTPFDTLYNVIGDTEYREYMKIAAVTRLRFFSDPLDNECLCRAVNKVLNRENHRSHLLNLLYMQEPLLLIIENNVAIDIISSSRFPGASEALMLSLIGFSIAGFLPFLVIYTIVTAKLRREQFLDDLIAPRDHLDIGGHFSRGDRRTLDRFLIRARRLRI